MIDITIIRNNSLPIYTQISNQLKDYIIKQKLAPDTSLPSVYEIASIAGVSLRTADIALKKLIDDGICYRRPKKGTFVAKPTKICRKDKTIYILVPYPAHVTLQLQSSLEFRRIIYGASTENKNSLIQTLPVSRRNEDPLTHINWNAVEHIPEGARVFVNGMWFKDLLPFLLERNVQGIFLGAQQDRVEFPEQYKKLVEAKWNFITLDRSLAMTQAVEYLYDLGRRRIAVLKAYKNEPQHPFRQGMINGFERCGMIYDNKLYHEVDFKKSFLELEKDIVEFWKNTKFDALIVSVADSSKYIYRALTKKLRLRIPEDVAVMFFSDNPAYLDFDVPMTAIDFPNVKLGHEIVKIFERKNLTASESIFQATIIERESTKKGAGAYVNHIFMPEVPINHNITGIRK